MERLIPLQQRLDRFGQEDRGHGIDAELLLQLGTLNLLKTLFRLKSGPMQAAAAVEHQTQGALLGTQGCGQAIQIPVIFDVQLKRARWWSMSSSRQHLQLRAALRQFGSDRRSDATGTDHKRQAAPVGRGWFDHVNLLRRENRLTEIGHHRLKLY